MAKIKQPYQCDECGKPREKDANHWWLMWVELPIGRTPEELMISPWNLEKTEKDGVKHLCGQECVQKKVELFLATRSLEPPSSKPISTGKETP